MLSQPSDAVKPAAVQANPKTVTRRYSWKTALLSLFLLILGAHCWLAITYALPLPFGDQWDGEWSTLLKPWLEGRLRFAALFSPHNEHRIFLTRLAVLGLFVTDGRWDCFVEIAFNAVFYSLSWTAVTGVLAHFLGRAYSMRIFGAAAILGTVPIGYENTLWGFQSQFYFMWFLSLAAIWGVGFQTPGAPGWWAGLLCAGLALLSMASGFMAAAALCGLFGWRWLVERRRPTNWEELAVICCMTAVVVGLTTRHEVPRHASLRVESLPKFALAIGRFAGWPYVRFSWMGIIMWTPILILTGFYIRRRMVGCREESALQNERRTEMLLTVGLWVMMQTVAMAYTRGGNYGFAASRYGDLLATGTLINFLALPWPPRSIPVRWQRIAMLGAIFWMLIVSFKLTLDTERCFTHFLPWVRERAITAQVQERVYLETGKMSPAFHDNEFRPKLDMGSLEELLDDPKLRAVLSLDRSSIPLLSWWALRLLQSGPLLLGTGAILAAITVVKGRQREV